MPRRRTEDPQAEPRQHGVRGRPLVCRTNLSLSEDLLGELDAMVEGRGFASRSQAVATVLHRSLVAYRHDVGDRVMVGTITLFYDNKVAGLRERLADLQQENIAEVISSLHVHLADNQTLEVILVQGPAQKLQRIADEVITRKGVISGHLELAAALIPQVHPTGEHGLQVAGNTVAPTIASNEEIALDRSLACRGAAARITRN